MKRLFFILIILSVTSIAFSQSFTIPCKDPNKIENIYYPCYDQYDPVCGCDGVTYRSICSAESQYALVAGNWMYGPCTNFHYVVEPNLINYVLKIDLYKKKAGYINMIIYDVYGHIFLQQTFSLPVGKTEKEIDEVNSFQHGLYILEIDSDGEKIIRKFFKVNNS